MHICLLDLAVFVSTKPSGLLALVDDGNEWTGLCIKHKLNYFMIYIVYNRYVANSHTVAVHAYGLNLEVDPEVSSPLLDLLALVDKWK